MIIVDVDNNLKPIYQRVIISVKSDKILSPKVIRELNGTVERENGILGILITLYPMPNLIKESKKYGSYTNKLTSHTYDKIQVVFAEELFSGKRMELPTAKDILKEADRKEESKQTGLFS